MDWWWWAREVKLAGYSKGRGGKGQLEALNWDRVAKSTDWSGTQSQNGVLLEGERLNRVLLMQEYSVTTFNETCIVCFFSKWVSFFIFSCFWIRTALNFTSRFCF